MVKRRYALLGWLAWKYYGDVERAGSSTSLVADELRAGRGALERLAVAGVASLCHDE